MPYAKQTLHPAQPHAGPRHTPLLLWALLITLLSACGSGGSAQQPTPTPAPTRAPADERALGEPTAPVTLIEYGDYQ